LETLTRDEKRDVISSLEVKSTREAERALLFRSSSPERFVYERQRPISPTHTELKLVVSTQTLEELERLKGLMAHSHPYMSFSELVAHLAHERLKKLDPARATYKRGKSAPEVGFARAESKSSPPAPAVEKSTAYDVEESEPSYNTHSIRRSPRGSP